MSTLRAADNLVKDLETLAPRDTIQIESDQIQWKKRPSTPDLGPRSNLESLAQHINRYGALAVSEENRALAQEIIDQLARDPQGGDDIEGWAEVIANDVHQAGD